MGEIIILPENIAKAAAELELFCFIPHCYYICCFVSFQQLDEQIAHYKDQIQELKAKSNLEAKYVKKECQVNSYVAGKLGVGKGFHLMRHYN